MNLALRLLLATAPLAPGASAGPTTPPRDASLAPAPGLEFDHEHAGLTGVLRRVVLEKGVDYAALKKDPAALRSYLKTLEAVQPTQLEGWTKQQQYAFWINAYNAYTLDLVVRAYPVASIKDIGSATQSVWKKEFIPLARLAGRQGKLSLDTVEHGILRPTFQDARVHAAVNCASVSCPPLLGEAFVAARLDTQLDGQVRAWLADSSRNRLDQRERKLRVSRIFDWFEDDFVRDAGSVQAWIQKYAPESAEWLKSAKDVRIEFLDYDWDLNHAPKRGS